METVSDDRILESAARMLGRKPDRIFDRSPNGAFVKFAWQPGRGLDPLNISDWYHLSDLGIYDY
jgi:hypothetical protein